MRLLGTAILSTLGAALLAAAPGLSLAAGGKYDASGQAGGKQDIDVQAGGRGFTPTGVEDILLGPEGLPIYPGAREIEESELRNLGQQAEGVEVRSEHMLGAYLVDQPAKLVGMFYAWALAAEGFTPEAMLIDFGDDPYEGPPDEVQAFVSKNNRMYQVVLSELEGQTLILFQRGPEGEMTK